jgi:hypothetical protein
MARLAENRTEVSASTLIETGGPAEFGQRGGFTGRRRDARSADNRAPLILNVRRRQREGTETLDRHRVRSDTFVDQIPGRWSKLPAELPGEQPAW